ncbi:MAG: hypothetical protein HC772_02145 [Leptolyngbyaceae cyanobacterium CRU_2_3]|nr:hypothetical protein [Leptolyngbyaceae cyanobacterium CRU_2_3]
MYQIDQSFRNLAVTLRWFAHPALFLSLVLHGLLLFTALPTPSKKDEVIQPNAEIITPLTRLPTSPLPKPVSPTPWSPPSSPIAPPEQQLPLTAKPNPDQPPSALPIVRESPTLQAKSFPSPIPDSDTPPVTNLRIPFADFPDLAGSQIGCFGSNTCRQIGDGTPFRNAAQTLEQQMVSQGYKVTARSDLEDTGQKIYQLVAQDGATRYLNVLSSDVGATVYLLSPEPITLSDLQEVEIVQANLVALLNQLGGAATASQIPYPTLFLAGERLRPEINQIRLVPDVMPDQLTSRLITTLKDYQFSFVSIGSYGGGEMYEVVQKGFTGYVNIVPAGNQPDNRSGTMIVLWNTLPQ